jgi:hypothetical protein
MNIMWETLAAINKSHLAMVKIAPRKNGDDLGMVYGTRIVALHSFNRDV